MKKGDGVTKGAEREKRRMMSIRVSSRELCQPRVIRIAVPNNNNKEAKLKQIKLGGGAHYLRCSDALRSRMRPE